MRNYNLDFLCCQIRKMKTCEISAKRNFCKILIVSHVLKWISYFPKPSDLISKAYNFELALEMSYINHYSNASLNFIYENMRFSVKAFMQLIILDYVNILLNEWCGHSQLRMLILRKMK